MLCCKYKLYILSSYGAKENNGGSILYGSFGRNVNYGIADLAYNCDGAQASGFHNLDYTNARVEQVVIENDAVTGGSKRTHGVSRLNFACGNVDEEGCRDSDDEHTGHLEDGADEACGSDVRNVVRSPPKRRKALRNKSMAWDYFEKKENKWHCKQPLCNTFYSMSTASTNLLGHLVNAHSIKLIDNETVIPSPGNSSDEEKNDSPVTPKGQKYGQDVQNKLTKYYLNFLIQDLQPFHLSQSKSFLQFCHALNPKYIVPNNQTMREQTNLTFLSRKAEIIKNISLNKSLFNFTTDGWSSIRVDPYIALTCHFIDNNWKVKSFLLDFKDFPHPHDAYNISETLLEVKN